MNAAGRLAAFGTGLVVAFAGAYATAAAVVPESAVANWNEGANSGDHSTMAQSSTAAATSTTGGSAAGLPGLSLGQDGYVLAPVSAPPTAGRPGELTFKILRTDGAPVVDYVNKHDKDLHLIAVRSDGTGFQHTHPTLDKATGTWSTPWTWDAAGTYRVFADFTPADVENGPALVLTRNVQVAGDFAPVTSRSPRTQAQVAGFTVTLDGNLVAGSPTELTVTVTKDGKPVTTLQPYLGAFGHLVALRDGDLAYLHVHPEGDEPKPGQNGGPQVKFATDVPTAGRYLLYLDFQVDGQVHTAEFVVDAARGDATQPADTSSAGTHSGGH